MDLTRIVEPDALAIELGRLKVDLKITTDEEDLDLKDKIEAATQAVEGLIGQSLMTQDWELALDAEDLCRMLQRGPVLKLFRPPLQSVIDFKWYSDANVESAWAASNYVVDVRGARVFPADGYSWPTGYRALRAFVITYRAGYGGTWTAVPPVIRRAIARYVGYLWENRELEFALITSDTSNPANLTPSIRDSLAQFNENLSW